MAFKFTNPGALHQVTFADDLYWPLYDDQGLVDTLEVLLSGGGVRMRDTLAQGATRR